MKKEEPLAQNISDKSIYKKFFIFFLVSSISLTLIGAILYFVLKLFFSTIFTSSFFDRYSVGESIWWFIADSYIFSYFYFMYFNKENNLLQKKIFILTGFFVTISAFLSLIMLGAIVGGFSGYASFIPFFTILSIIPATILLGLISRFLIIKKFNKYKLAFAIITLTITGIAIMMFYYWFIGRSVIDSFIIDVRSFGIIKPILSVFYLITSVFLGKYIYKFSTFLQ